MYIDEQLYQQIIKRTVVLCVDIIIRNHTGQVLLVKRANDPLKGEWWVIGGRMEKQETVLTACIRKVREEVGLAVQNLRPVGFYEHIWFGDDSPYEFPLHTLSLVYEAKALPGEIVLDDQSTEWKWDDLPERFDYTPFQPEVRR